MQENKLFSPTLKTRFVSAIVILFIFLIGILYSKVLFSLTMLVVLCCMLYEWCTVVQDNRLYLLFGFLSFPISILFVATSRWLNQDIFLLLNYFCIIWTVDSMALVGGKVVQGPPLAPTISPSKTISGFFIGTMSGGVMALLISMLHSDDIGILSKIGVASNRGIFLFGVAMGVLAQMSDLLMSYFKRQLKIKDYSNIIPGHGGMIDRFDSIILTSPVLFYLVI